jgi:DNA-binding GntR family transcriptional regulator
MESTPPSEVSRDSRWPLVRSAGAQDGFSRLPLGAAVTSRIREEIVFGLLAPGDRLTENELRTRFGVSRTPIREALKSLESEGTVERISPSTIIVPSMSKDDARILYRTCATLEGFSARLLAEGPRGVELDPLVTCLDNMSRAATHGDPLAVLAHESEFHNTILALSQNRYAIRFMSSVQTILNRYGYFSSLATPERVRSAVSMHNKILSRIREGSPEEAEQAVTEHIMNRLDTLLAHWPASNAAQSPPQDPRAEDQVQG